MGIGMQHRVRFSVKNRDKNNPDYGLLSDRTLTVSSFREAVARAKSLRSTIEPTKEELVGYPVIEEAA